LSTCFGVHAVGGAGGATFARADREMLEGSAVQPPTFGGTDVVAGVVVHATSAAETTVRFPAQDPPTLVHVQLQVALPSPVATLRSVLVSPLGQVG
jgi:hypothetical protein